MEGQTDGRTDNPINKLTKTQTDGRIDMWADKNMTETDGQVDRPTDGLTASQTDGRMNRWKGRYR